MRTLLPTSRSEWRELLTAHQERLREWADNYPPTFADKHALVAAEIARLEGRDADAMRLYEQAIRSARENGFVQNEGLAHEVGRAVLHARGFETSANAYLRNARYCYLRWGARRQGAATRPALSAVDRCGGASVPQRPSARPVQQLDVGDGGQSLAGGVQRDRLAEADRDG